MITFTKENALKVANGTKTQTRRWTPFRPAGIGSIHKVMISRFQPNTHFADIFINRVWKWDGINISIEDAIAEGFPTQLAFLQEYQRLNAHKDLWTPNNNRRENWAVEFDVIRLTDFGKELKKESP